MMNIKKKTDGINSVVIIAAIAVVIGVCIIYSFVGGEGAKFYKNSPVVATINGKPVYQAEADSIVKVVMSGNDKPVNFKDLDERSKNLIVREVAAQRAMLKEAKAKGVKEDDDMMRKVHEFRNKLIIDQFLAKIINGEVTQEKLLAKYDELEKTVKGKQQIKASHILLSSEDEAKNVVERLQKDSFAKVAKEASLDSSTKDKGGDLGYLIAGTMDPDFEKVALALKIGEFSAPVKTKFGWHVIKVEEKRIASVPPFESLKQRIAQDTSNEALKKHADELLKDVKIELVDDNADKTEEKSEKKEEKSEVKQKEDKKEDKKDKKDEKKKSEK